LVPRQETQPPAGSTDGASTPCLPLGDRRLAKGTQDARRWAGAKPPFCEIRREGVAGPLGVGHLYTVVGAGD
jgi:hypothetical protein